MLGLFSRQPRSAAEWVARFHAGHWQAEDERAFAAWLREAPERRAEIELLSRLDVLSAGLLESPTVRAELDKLRTPTGGDQKPGFAGRRRTALASGLALAGVAGLAGMLLWPAADLYETEIGQTTMLNLPDGSTLWLNTDSRVRLHFRAEQRLVRLERGQAFFKVRSDAMRPFVVDAGSQRVVVTGTQFDVRRDGAEVAVAVLEGHVQVRPSSSAVTAVVPPPGLALSARQSARFRADASPRMVEDAQVERLSAWRDGRILLDNTTLDAALLDVNRYSRIPLVLADADASHLTISGEFRVGDLEGVVFALHELYGLRARREADRIVLEMPAAARPLRG